ncbi:uncharacterized protein [Gossypium hirsutum]|uniref:Uncharacterized protein isoform X3 n=1 Tax=Gossypium hirsutum TaxID=3635 RepID=A0ABM3ACM3_GOSHI|nr:uncharacterized protein LOC107954391 isoform X3 [Gossypium hirsutum]
MQGDEARLLLGFPPNSRPSPSQIKAAYRKKVWESHPDLFPVHEKHSAESKFKLVQEEEVRTQLHIHMSSEREYQRLMGEEETVV